MRELWALKPAVLCRVSLDDVCYENVKKPAAMHSRQNEMKEYHIMKNSALTNEEFAAFLQENNIAEFYIAGADAAACIKSTCYMGV